jgi:hypothetical protein
VHFDRFSPLPVHAANPLPEPKQTVLPDVHTPYDYCERI